MTLNNRGQVMGPHPWGRMTALVIGIAVGFAVDPWQVGASPPLFGALGALVVLFIYESLKIGTAIAYLRVTQE